MKKWTGLVLALFMCLSLAACGGGKADATPAPEVPAAGLARAILESQADQAGLTELTGEDLTDRLTAVYGLEGWEEAAVYAAGGMDAREIAVVRFADAEAARAGAEALEDYRRGRVGDFFGYAPQEAELLDGAKAFASGTYAALLVCEDLDAAEGAFNDCLAGAWVPALGPAESESPSKPAGPEESEKPARTAVPEPTETPEPMPVPTPGPVPATPAPTAAPEPTPGAVVNPDLDISGFTPFDPPKEAVMERYDTTAIQAAWETGDASGLSQKDADILARCREVLGELIDGDMTDFEKELAVHDWMLDWGGYDQTVHDASNHAGRVGYRDPSGMLVGGYGNCLGYSSTFQLLMDLAGVECATVVGASSGSTSDHAWNMVRLDGEWYCVDVTWDDPTISRGTADAALRHRFFNVTSDRMRESDHQWNYLCVPEATAAHYRWDGVSDLPAPRESP